MDWLDRGEDKPGQLRRRPLPLPLRQDRAKVPVPAGLPRRAAGPRPHTRALPPLRHPTKGPVNAHIFLRTQSWSSGEGGGCRHAPLKETYGDAALEKAGLADFAESFEKLTLPSLHFAKRIGNSYTSSLYLALASALTRHHPCPTIGRPNIFPNSSYENPSAALGKRFLLFSYGSGMTAAAFSIVVADSDPGIPPLPLHPN